MSTPEPTPTPTPAAPAAPPVVPPKAATPEAAQPIQLPEDHPLVKTLAAQKEQIRELKAQNAQFGAAAEAGKSESQQLMDRLTALEQERDQAKADALRNRVANAKGVPAALITGATEEELNASADALLAFRGPDTRAPSPNEAGAGRQGTNVDTTPSIDAQIADAEKAGNYSLAISLKRQKAAEAAQQKG